MMSVPVVFFDGEQETSLGSVLITPSFNFKVFQSIISEKLVLSPHQFSIYLSHRSRNGTRLPVTGKMDFSAVSRENDCFFLVVLKRSRRDRRRKSRDISPAAADIFDIPPANMMLLRRDGNSVAMPIGLDRFGYENRVKELQMEKERYLMNMGLGFGSGAGLGLNLGQEKADNATTVCEECLRAKQTGMEVGFHWCVYDTVTAGFKSPAGPIARPGKRSD